MKITKDAISYLHILREGHIIKQKFLQSCPSRESRSPYCTDRAPLGLRLGPVGQDREEGELGGEQAVLFGPLSEEDPTQLRKKMKALENEQVRM